MTLSGQGERTQKQVDKEEAPSAAASDRVTVKKGVAALDP